MTTLLESKARPFGSSKGVVLSMVIHGAVVAAVLLGTAASVLPPREKVEEHPVMYVAAPPPPPVPVASEPLKVARPKVAPKAQPQKVFRAPKPVAVQPPKVPATPALVAPVKIAVTIPAPDPNARPTIGDVVAPATTEPVKSSGGSGRSCRADPATAGTEISRRLTQCQCGRLSPVAIRGERRRSRRAGLDRGHFVESSIVHRGGEGRADEHALSPRRGGRSYRAPTRGAELRIQAQQVTWRIVLMAGSLTSRRPCKN